MNERIKKLRKTLDLTQQEFADKIGMKRNTVANYETNRNEPSNSVVSLICKTFTVSEVWLRTGKGEMFAERSESDELAAAVERLITGESAEFKRRLINALSTLKDEHWLILEEKLKEIVGMREAPSAVPVFSPTPDDKAEAREMAMLAYKQALLEKKQESSASSASASAEEPA